MSEYVLVAVLSATVTLCVGFMGLCGVLLKRNNKKANNPGMVNGVLAARLDAIGSTLERIDGKLDELSRTLAECASILRQGR